MPPRRRRSQFSGGSPRESLTLPSSPWCGDQSRLYFANGKRIEKNSSLSHFPNFSTSESDSRARFEPSPIVFNKLWIITAKGFGSIYKNRGGIYVFILMCVYKWTSFIYWKNYFKNLFKKGREKIWFFTYSVHMYFALNKDVAEKLFVICTLISSEIISDVFVTISYKKNQC